MLQCCWQVHQSQMTSGNGNDVVVFVHAGSKLWGINGADWQIIDKQHLSFCLKTGGRVSESANCGSLEERGRRFTN